MKFDENGKPIEFGDNIERILCDPTYKQITYDENGNKIYPAQPRKYAHDGLWALWLLVPLLFLLTACAGAGGFLMGAFFIWLYLKHQAEDATRRWKLECEDDAMRRKRR